VGDGGELRVAALHLMRFSKGGILLTDILEMDAFEFEAWGEASEEAAREIKEATK
jgi:hypothetical protein